jgi:transcription elongation factor Elf1
MYECFKCGALTPSTCRCLKSPLPAPIAPCPECGQRVWTNEPRISTKRNVYHRACADNIASPIIAAAMA